MRDRELLSGDLVTAIGFKRLERNRLGENAWLRRCGGGDTRAGNRRKYRRFQRD